jgi:hypothetical protein
MPPEFSFKDPLLTFPSTPKLPLQAFIVRYKTLAALIITPMSSLNLFLSAGLIA